MTDFLIKHYWHSPGTSSMNASKAPKLSNAAGSMITVLDAVLVDGFGSSAVSMDIHPTDVNKAVITEPAHGYELTTRIKVDGCDNVNFNTEYEIIEIPDANTYVIDVTGLHSQSAGTQVTTSSTITVKVPSLGWTKEFSGTNKAVYRMKGGSRRYLWVNDDDATNNGITEVRGAWEANGPDFSNLKTPFPSIEQTPETAHPRWHHWIYSNEQGAWGTENDIAWTIIGTEKFFYLSIQHYSGQDILSSTNSSRLVFVFGDANPYNINDTSATILATGDNLNYSSTDLLNLNAFSWWNEDFSYKQTFAGTWFNGKYPVYYRMVPPFGESVHWWSYAGVGRGASNINPYIDIIPFGQPILLVDEYINSVRAEMPGMAVSPIYLNSLYPQNTIINVNGTRYMSMSTKTYSYGSNDDGCFFVQIDGDMHTLKGIV